MTALTRRRGNNPHEESWQIYFTDVRTGTIGARAGVPIHADQWGWSIGFYPGMEPGTWRSGIAATFEAAREAFEAAWSELRLTIPDSAFAESRPDRNRRARRWRQGACGELPAPRTHHRRAGGQRVLAEVSRQLMGWMAPSRGIECHNGGRRRSPVMGAIHGQYYSNRS
jgi:hypothetical protein